MLLFFDIGGKMDSNNSNSPKTRSIFPPLMSTMDAYLDAGPNDRSNQFVESSKSTGKKKKAKKVRRKKLLTPLKRDGLEEVSDLSQFSNPIVSNKPMFGSPKKSRSAGRLDQFAHPEHDDDDRDNFSAHNPTMALESPLKPVTPGGGKLSAPTKSTPRGGRIYKEPEASVVSTSLEVMCYFSQIFFSRLTFIYLCMCIECSFRKHQYLEYPISLRANRPSIVRLNR